MNKNQTEKRIAFLRVAIAHMDYRNMGFCWGQNGEFLTVDTCTQEFNTLQKTYAR